MLNKLSNDIQVTTLCHCGSLASDVQGLWSFSVLPVMKGLIFGPYVPVELFLYLLMRLRVNA